MRGILPTRRTEIPYSVQAGNAAAGMCIDFYGRFESEAVRRPDGTSRLVYVTPAGRLIDGGGFDRPLPRRAARGAGAGVHRVRDLAEGQKLWCFRAGTPGGPAKYTLRRLAIRPDLYARAMAAIRGGSRTWTPTPAAGRRSSISPEWTGSLVRRDLVCDPDGVHRSAR